MKGNAVNATDKKKAKQIMVFSNVIPLAKR